MANKRCWIALALLVLPSVASGGAETFRIDPPELESGDQISLVFDVFWPESPGRDGVPQSSSVSLTDGAINVTAVVWTVHPDFHPRPPPFPRHPVAVSLGTLRPGDYVLDYDVASQFGSLATGTLGFTVAPRPIPAIGSWGLVLLVLGVVAFGGFRMHRSA